MSPDLLLSTMRHHGVLHMVRKALGPERQSEKGIFYEVILALNDRDDVLTALQKIAARDWMESKRLDRDGRVLPRTFQSR